MRTDNLYQYRKSAPLTPTVFNWGPDSFAEAVIRRVPLKDDCTNKPGKLIVSVQPVNTSYEKLTTLAIGIRGSM